MFHVHNVFTVSGEGTQERSISLLIDGITSFSLAAYDMQEQPLVAHSLLSLSSLDNPTQKKATPLPTGLPPSFAEAQNVLFDSVTACFLWVRY